MEIEKAAADFLRLPQPSFFSAPLFPHLLPQLQNVGLIGTMFGLRAAAMQDAVDEANQIRLGGAFDDSEGLTDDNI